MDKLGSFLNAFIGLTLIPIFIFAHLGITESIEKSVKKRDKFFEFWRERLDGKTYEEISSKLLGTYDFATIKLLAEPKLYYMSLKRRILTSPKLEKVIATVLTLICLRSFGALTLL